MRLGLELSGQQLVCLAVVSSTALVEELVIIEVGEIGIYVVFDEIVEVGHGNCSNSIRTVDGAVDFVLPAQIVG